MTLPSFSLRVNQYCLFITVVILACFDIFIARSNYIIHIMDFSQEKRVPNFIPTVPHLTFTNMDDDYDDDYDENDRVSTHVNRSKESSNDNQGFIEYGSLNEDVMNSSSFVNVSSKDLSQLNDTTNQTWMSDEKNKKIKSIRKEKPPSRLPYPISMLQDIDDPIEETDIPFFWHVPKAGGSEVKDIVHRCFGLTRSQPVRPEPSLEVLDNNFLNVNLASPEGITQAKEMGVMESNLLQFVVSSYFFRASELFTPNQKGRMFTMLRHPVDVAISLFYYLGTATWEKEYDKSWANMTLMEYAQSDLVRENWMTRFLTDEMEAPLTNQHVAVATQILAEKCVIGLLDKMEESIHRFESYFGWKLDRRGEKCLDRFLNMRINQNDKHDHSFVEGTDEWEMLLASNEFDVAVYENARALYDYQGELLFSVEHEDAAEDTDIR